MPDRVTQLAQMRAPNQSGVDAGAVVRALAENPQLLQTPTTYAYGMTVEDAQKEGQLGSARQQQQHAMYGDSRNAALQQDQQLFDQAMKAHDAYMRERNLAVSEASLALEREYKRAMMSRIPAETKRLEAEASKLESDIARMKLLDETKVKMKGHDGVEREIPLSMLYGTGNRYVLDFLSGGKVGGPTFRAPSSAQQKMDQNTSFYISRGFSPEDAQYLANNNGASLISSLGKAFTKQKDDTRKATKYGDTNWGVTKDASGKETPRTEAQYDADTWADIVNRTFPQLSPNGRSIMLKWGPYAGEQMGLLGEGLTSSTSQPEITSQDMQQILNLLEALSGN